MQERYPHVVINLVDLRRNTRVSIIIRDQLRVMLLTSEKENIMFGKGQFRRARSMSDAAKRHFSNALHLTDENLLVIRTSRAHLAEEEEILTFLQSNELKLDQESDIKRLRLLASRVSYRLTSLNSCLLDLENEYLREASRLTSLVSRIHETESARPQYPRDRGKGEIDRNLINQCYLASDEVHNNINSLSMSSCTLHSRICEDLLNQD